MLPGAFARNAHQLRLGGVHRLQSRGFAENPREILKRITSTKSIQKITKSMKMVSAAKLRGDTTRLMDGRPFSQGFQKVFQPTLVEGETPIPEYKAPLYVLISSDRGLCGGVNSNVAKTVRAAIDADVAKGLSPKVIVVGDKGSALLLRTHGEYLLGSIGECWKTPMNFSKAALIAERIASLSGFDRIRICYNKFVNSISYNTQFKDVPIFPVLISNDTENPELPTPLNRYEVEYESTEEAVKNIFEMGLAVELYGCCLESATSEQSSRMTAMDNASKNASEMVETLTIRYNRARQARITTELIEIISGAESLKG